MTKTILRTITCTAALLLTMTAAIPVSAFAEETDGSISAEEIYVTDPNDTGFTKYELTDEELIKIASLCQAEQSSSLGAAAEASLLANRYELYGWRYNSIYDYARYCRWFAHAASHMDRMNAYSDVIDAVRTVLVDGKRTLPAYIDEHDCFSDIWKSTNNGQSIRVSDRAAYQKHITKCSNVYSGYWTFYSFPDTYSDPFGYSNSYLAETMDDRYYDLYTGECIHDSDVGFIMNSNPYGQVIPDGDYRITVMNDKSVTLKGEVTETYSNAAFHLSDYDAIDIWNITYNPDSGFYRIKLRDTGLYLDIENAEIMRNTNIQLFTFNDCAAQEWAVVPTYDGYALQSRCGGFFLNADTAVMSEDIMYQPTEDELQLAEETGQPIEPHMVPARNANVDWLTDSQNQILGIIPVNGIQPLTDPVYEMYDYNDNKHVTIKDNSLTLSDKTNYIRLQYLGDGWYALRDTLTGLAVTTAGEYEPVSLQEFTNDTNQRWMIRKANGHYAVISANDGYCLNKDMNTVPYGPDIEKWDFKTVRPTDITLDTLPAKLTYEKGEPLDLSGLKVTAKFDNGSTADVTALVGVKGSTTNTGDITIIYGGKEKLFRITVSKPKQETPLETTAVTEPAAETTQTTTETKTTTTDTN